MGGFQSQVFLVGWGGFSGLVKRPFEGSMLYFSMVIMGRRISSVLL